MSDRNALSQSFRTVESFIRANLADLTDDHVHETTAPGASDAHWVLGHVVYWRSQLAGMLGGDPLWSADDYPEFRGVEKGDRPESLGRPFAERL